MHDLIYFSDGDDRRQVRQVKRFLVDVPVLSILTGATDANP